MIVQCNTCQVLYGIDESKLTDKGVNFRCLNCHSVFKVYPQDVVQQILSSPEESESLPKETSQIESSFSEQKKYVKEIPKEKKNLLSPSVKGDLSGAISAAIITLPMSIGYGIIAFAPLGLEFAPHAAIIGIYSAVFSGFFAALFGGTPIQITGPKAPLTLILAAVVASLAIHIPEGTAHRETLIVGFASLCVLIAGVIQVLFGALHAGNLVKFVPFPVVSGFMNGIAFLLIFKQLKPLLGVDQKIPFMALLDPAISVQPFTMFVGLTTICVLFIAKRYITIKVIPASLLGLLSGTALYYFFWFIHSDCHLGPIVGNIKAELPQPYIFIDFFKYVSPKQLWDYLPNLFISGFVLALLASMESLLSSVVSDNLTETRHNSNKELLGQGIGNLACACFGALAGAGSIPRAMANYKAGGRTRLSGMICGVTVFIIIMTMGPLVGKIPMAAIAGIIIAVGISMFDSWTMNLFKKLTAPKGQRREALVNLFITLIVAVVTISVNLIVAVGIGVAIASALFMSKMGKSIVKRKYYGSQFQSKKMRNVAHATFIEKEGRQIVVFELQGPIFFGSADNLANQIEEAMLSATYCILDMKRVNEIDSTGANIIIQTKKGLEKEGKYLLFSYLKNNPALWGFMDTMDVADQIDDTHFYGNTDAALEWVEDRLIESAFKDKGQINEVPLDQMEIVQGFTENELNELKKKLHCHYYKGGDNIFREGDPGRDLFFLTRGSVTVKIQLPERNQLIRLFTFSAGVIFGEVALLDGNPRSADIWAEEDAEVYRLSVDDFNVIRKEQPEIAVKLIQNMARTLTRHLRRSSNVVRALEDS